MRAARTHKGKSIRKETSTLMDLPNGITLEFMVITEMLVSPLGPLIGLSWMSPTLGSLLRKSESLVKSRLTSI